MQPRMLTRLRHIDTSALGRAATSPGEATSLQRRARPSTDVPERENLDALGGGGVVEVVTDPIETDAANSRQVSVVSTCADARLRGDQVDRLRKLDFDRTGGTRPITLPPECSLSYLRQRTARDDDRRALARSG